jgi:hypothetical protein
MGNAKYPRPDPLSTLRKVEGVKAASYGNAHVLDGARSAAAVSAGLRVMTPLAPSPHWAPLVWARSSISMRLPATSRSVRWLLLAQPLVMTVSPLRDFLDCFGSASGRFELQAAIMHGNVLIAAEVGL